MRHVVATVIALIIVAAGPLLTRPALAENFSIGMRTDSLSLGINIGGSPPPVVVVPHSPVYMAPNLPHNYFVYHRHYYLFHEGAWFSAARYDGPWTVIALERVPRPVLAVPVDYYNRPSGHWKKHGPPPWAEARGREKHDKKEHERRDHGNREHGKKWKGED
jgi:hypothetical protein